MILEGAADREACRVYIERVLVPTLRPGQLVILDNLSVHKQAPLRRSIEAAGCRVFFLPTYSPDFNPIGQAFAKIAQFLRRAQAFGAVTDTDAAGFFQGCGYLPQ